MTLSIRETLSKLPGGGPGPLASWGDVGRYLLANYVDNKSEKERREKAALRQRMYQCQGEGDMLEMLQKVFQSDVVIELRRKWIEFAKYNNVIRRVIGELASVYSQPAIRTVDGDDNNANYQEVQRLSRQHEVMQRINRMAVLHRALVVIPRMRQNPAGDWEPTIDVVTPASFFAVRDPLDPTQLIAIGYENDYALVDSHRTAPRWTFLTWNETLMMTSAGEIVFNEPHTHGRIPGILLTLDPPEGRLIDQDTGEDLVAAQKSIWLLNILHLKELKSATTQIIVQGDTSQTIRNQVSDTDTTGSLPEGVSISTVNRGMDVSIFPAGAEHVADSVGANFGISPSVRRGDQVASADARDLQRIPLREIRLQQQIPLREFEREFVAIQSLVVKAHRPDLAFTTDGWGVDFADPQTPLGTAESLQVLEKELQLGLASELTALMRRNPDLTRDQAKSVLKQLIDDRTFRIQALKQFAVMSGGLAQGSMPTGLRDDARQSEADQIDEDGAPSVEQKEAAQ